MKLEIVTLGEPILRARAKPVALKEVSRLGTLIDDMIETMHQAAGVGLAAPQVGVSKRLFVYDVGDGAAAIINAEIVRAEGEELGLEGCLSIPRLHGEVPRATRIEVKGVGREGEPIRIRATDYLARVFQHEIDHLDGVLFIDRADPVSLHWITEEEEEDRIRSAQERRGKADSATTVPPAATDRVSEATG